MAPKADSENKKISLLWWGRFDADYSRNRILRNLFIELGYAIHDFHPHISGLGDAQARLHHLPAVDLVWVPCFRQRDVLSAARWARRQGIPMVFDPLISAWDKQVFERRKFNAESPAANKLLKQERKQFQSTDMLVADTAEHAQFFSDTFDVDPVKIQVVPVGAEEPLFHAATIEAAHSEITQVLFYGSFIHLQGPQVIIEAARLCQNLPIHWHLLGKGPLLEQCKQAAKGLSNCVFEDWIDYRALPGRIHQADILLGVFGRSDKAGRVIPNKVYQALACGRTVVSRTSSAYPEALNEPTHSGVFQVAPDQPQALADAVIRLSGNRQLIMDAGENARKTYEAFFSNAVIKDKLKSMLALLMGQVV